ncbi:class I adenylate-forming enzyme family protein [Dickeya solani]|uniref:Acyl-CoA ligase n=1 Tax=Dickeya solani D s0432-1 TaxID=1231725 RepID=A0AAV3KEI0_9GAMM|nr:class I adenylate-forming enzyme family protein [Dickeya solani]ANE75583.1 long-chain fatty acid--CoA ligase [Dickeya solani IPO 2222]AUC43034.1 Fatty acid biosynthesis [Dickeya solani RNS 08.23.3.1.A]AUH09003.1 long-chain fatty acid--CoA ligase [Dickeya solani D s0432-1]AUH12983.1 long-chain fatty acid--CoA ligase [Dickeya solani]AYQ45985.1 Long-chain-fatty-acid--CoA ligase [Dickeya solani]
MTNITHLTAWLDRAAKEAANKTAVIDTDREVSWFMLRLQARQLADHLRENGVEKGDRVIVCLPNSLTFVLYFWALQYLGAIFIPLNPDTKAGKLSWLVDNAGCRLLIADRALKDEIGIAQAGEHWQQYNRHTRVFFSNDVAAALVEEPYRISVERDRQSTGIDLDLACIIYTSGSTGHPKGVMLSRRNMITAAGSVAGYLQLRSDDRIMSMIPMSFDYGLYQVIMSALAQCTLIVEPDFRRPLLSLQRMVTLRATVLPIVPTMLRLIAPLASRYNFGAIRTVTNTAAALHAGDIDQLHTIFPQAHIYSMYGLTECHRCTYLPPEYLATHPQSVGIAIPNTELWVVDDNGQRHTRDATGELVIRGATVMCGYWRNEEKSAEKLRPGLLPGERVLYTGDICRLDEQGLLYFVGRRDEMLKSCGEKVAPKEVEAVLNRHPQVVQAVVLGVPHPIYGDEIIACVVTRGDLNEKALSRWSKTQMESHMVPHRFRLMSQLPLNPNGKINRSLLQEQLTAGATAQVCPQPGLME